MSENKAYEALRAIEETEILLGRLAQHHQNLGDPDTAEVLLGGAGGASGPGP